MPQGEPEPHRHGTTAEGDQSPGGVVDGSNVVDVEGVPDPKHIGADSETEQESGVAAGTGLVRQDQDKKRSPAGDVKENHRDADAQKASLFVRVEGGAQVHTVPFMESAAPVSYTHLTLPTILR